MIKRFSNPSFIVLILKQIQIRYSFITSDLINLFILFYYQSPSIIYIRGTDSLYTIQLVIQNSTIRDLIKEFKKFGWYTAQVIHDEKPQKDDTLLSNFKLYHGYKIRLHDFFRTLELPL